MNKRGSIFYLQLVICSILIGLSLDCGKSRNPIGDSPFLDALKSKDAGKVKQLVRSGYDINARYQNGGTLLYWIAMMDEVEIARILLDNGADLTIPDDGGEIPLHNAAGCGNLNMVRFLVERGARVNAADARGNTPLMAASLNGRAGVVHFLLQAGAAVNLGNADGRTALKAAREAPIGEKAETVRILLEAGATERADVIQGQKFRPRIPPEMPEMPFWYWILLIAIVGLYLAGNWKMYTALNLPGWISLVPVFDKMALVRFCGIPSWWVVLLLCPCVGEFAWIPIIEKIVIHFHKPRWHILLFFFFRPIYVFYLGFFQRLPHVGSRS